MRHEQRSAGVYLVRGGEEGRQWIGYFNPPAANDWRGTAKRAFKAARSSLARLELPGYALVVMAPTGEQSFPLESFA